MDIKSLKILHIGTEKQWRGGENQVLLLSQKLRSKGVESIMAFPQKAVALERFSHDKFQTLPMSGKGGYHLIDALRLNKFCADNQVDIIHTHSGKGHSLGYLMKVLGCPAKLVVHRRVDFPIREGFLSKKKYLSDRVSSFVSISEAIKKSLIRYGVTENKIQIARSSVDAGKFESLEKKQCRMALGVLDDKPLIGIVAALTEEKGHETLLESLTKIEEDFLCFVAGDGERNGELIQKTRELGLEGKVRFLGFVKKPENLLKALDILVVPSKSEGLGSIALDGILADCLLIASDVGGLPEIVIHEKTGYLFEVGDSRTLTNHLTAALKEINPQILEQAKTHVKDNFSLDKMAEQTLKVYQDITQ